MLSDKGSADLHQGITLYDLLKRPEIKYDDLVQYGLAEKLEREISRMIDIHIKYEGYIKKQLAQVARFNKLENKLLPQDLDYLQLQGLSVEARQKLKKIKPLSLGQASRISGVSPADITALMIYLEKRRRS
jgi:tRNA uridine 5-carboxymethylaminomethyl modification enzyme